MFSIKTWRDGEKWTNWCENYISYPSQFYAPTSIEEICTIVKEHAIKGKTIRVTGAAHSFSPVAMPEQSALTLHGLRGLIQVDKEHRTATFYAGTYLYEVGPLLEEYGLSLSNMGDIQEQTLAGAISTGTHGTGITLGSFSSMVVKWGFVNGEGEYVEHVRGDDELSKALHVSVGLLGILVKVTIQVVPLYSLHYISERSLFSEEMKHYDQTIRAHRHVEWFYFPGSDTIQVKKMDAVTPIRQSTFKKLTERTKMQLLENGAFYIASELCKWKPSLSNAISNFSAKVISETERTDISYEVFPSPRSVKFVETEYAIPLKHFTSCMEEVHGMFKQRQFDVHFPIECRTTAGEEGYLSPTQGEESAFIAFHMYKGMNETAYFKWVHQLMQKYEGRPHWGKINQYDQANIEQFYPNANKFSFIRQQEDPKNTFLTTYFKHIFS